MIGTKRLPAKEADTRAVDIGKAVKHIRCVLFGDIPENTRIPAGVLAASLQQVNAEPAAQPRMVFTMMYATTAARGETPSLLVANARR